MRPRTVTAPPLWALPAVMAGGAAGTLVRYGLNRAFPSDPGALPLTTLGENLLGAALLGALVAYLGTGRVKRRWVRPLLGAGLLGSFTTFSAFATEVVVLVDDGRASIAALYIALTVVVGVAAAAGGARLIRWCFPSAGRAP